MMKQNLGKKERKIDRNKWIERRTKKARKRSENVHHTNKRSNKTIYLEIWYLAWAHTQNNRTRIQDPRSTGFSKFSWGRKKLFFLKIWFCSSAAVILFLFCFCFCFSESLLLSPSFSLSFSFSFSGSLLSMILFVDGLGWHVTVVAVRDSHVHLGVD